MINRIIKKYRPVAILLILIMLVNELAVAALGVVNNAQSVSGSQASWGKVKKILIQTPEESLPEVYGLLQTEAQAAHKAVLTHLAKDREKYGGQSTANKRIKAWEKTYQERSQKFFQALNGIKGKSRSYGMNQAKKSLLAALTPVENITSTMQVKNLSASSIVRNETASEPVIEFSSPEITRLVEALDRSPLKIYTYIRNEIKTEFYQGFYKTPARVLKDGCGNSLEQAALLVEMYKAAGINAQYVSGVIEVSEAQLTAWTGINSFDRAVSFLNRAGFAPQLKNGETRTVSLTHQWVKVEVPYLPGRGDKQDGKFTTVELDPAWKEQRRTFNTGLAWQLGLDTRNLLSRVRESAVIDTVNNSATRLNEGMIKERLAAWSEIIAKYTESSHIGVDELTGSVNIVPKVYPVLPASLPYKSSNPQYTDMLAADALNTFTLKIKNSDNTNLLIFSRCYTEIEGKTLALSFIPATSDDQAMLAACAASSTIPVYLIQVKPQLTLDGQVIATGEAVGMGSTIQLTISSGNIFKTFNLTAGSPYALTAYLPGEGDWMVVQAKILDLKKDVSQNTVYPLARFLDLLGQSFLIQENSFRGMLTGRLSLIGITSPAWAVTGEEMRITEEFGLPFEGETLGTSINGYIQNQQVFSPAGDINNEKQFVMLSALGDAAIAGTALVEFYGSAGITADGIINSANNQKIPVYQINAMNNVMVLEKLQPALRGLTEEQIKSIVNTDGNVIIPETTLAAGTWEGAAYLQYGPGGSQTQILPRQMLAFYPCTELLPGNLMGMATEGWQGSISDRINRLQNTSGMWELLSNGYLPAVLAVCDWTSGANPGIVDWLAVSLALGSPNLLHLGKMAVIKHAASPEIFSPNSDNIQDSLTINADFSDKADWEIAISGANGVVRKFTGSGEQAGVNWDGRDEVSQVLPSGEYHYEITAKSKDASRTPAMAAGITWLDNELPTAEIFRPQVGQELSGPVNIMGAADDLHFSSYSLEYGSGENPIQWTVIKTSNLPVIDNSLGILNTLMMANGSYTLRLLAIDRAGNRKEARQGFIVNNVSLDTTAPQVTIHTPSPGANITGVCHVSLTVTDNHGVSEVIIYGGGKEIFREKNPAENMEFDFDTRRLTNGNSDLLIRAFDVAGNVGTARINVTYANGIFDFRVNPISCNQTETPMVIIDASFSGEKQYTLSITTQDGTPVNSSLDEHLYAENNSMRYWWRLQNETGKPINPDGRYYVTFAADDGEKLIQEVLLYSTDGPLVFLESPKYDAEIKGLAEITGTIKSDRLGKYWLEYHRQGGDVWTLIGEGYTNVNSGLLGRIDATAMENDIYEVRLSARDKEGKVSYTLLPITIVGEAKVGNLSFSFVDMEIPIGNIPIQFIRSYDTLRKDKTGDLGYGWKMEVRTTEIREDSKHNLLITLPTGKRVVFYFKPTTFSVTIPDFGFGEINKPIYRTYAIPNYEASSGVTETLKVTDNDFLLIENGEYYDMNMEVFHPHRFVVETAGGSTYEIDRDEGVTRVLEPNGQSITFTDTAITHSKGISVKINRDSSGKIENVTGPDGEVVSYFYDGAGDLVSFTNQAGDVTTMEYQQHALTRILGPDGKPLLAGSYDASGRLANIADASGNEVKFIHNIEGRSESIFDRNGNLTVYYYDDNGRVTSMIDALNGVWTYTYDEAGNKTGEINPKGEDAGWTYDSFGNILTQTDAMGNATTYTYMTTLKQKNLPKYITDAAGNTTTYRYNAKGNATQMIDPMGVSTSYGYADDSTLTYTIDALGNKTGYEYDPETGLNTRINYPNGSTVAYTYLNYQPSPLTETRTWKDKDGTAHSLTYTNTYDKMGRLIKRKNPDGTSTETIYNNLGQKWKDIDLRGKTTEYQYDANGQLEWTIYPDGTKEHSKYDPNGNRSEFTDRYGRTTLYIYDAVNRLVKTINNDGSSSTNAYDILGRLEATTDTKGNITRYEYDSLGRTVKVIDPLSNATTNEYDKLSNRTAVTDARGNTTRFAYDALRRLITTTFADNTTQSFTYDIMGRKLSQTDQAGKTTRYEYDKFGNLITVTDPAGGVTRYEYDTQGNQIAQIDAKGRRTEFKYDDNNRLSERKLPMGQTESYTYNFDGSIATHTDFKGNILKYLYTPELGRLDYKLYPDNSKTTYEYYNDGRRKAIDNNSGRVTYEYDIMGRLSKVITSGIGEISYKYDKAGNRTELTTKTESGTSTVTYTYDELNRLKTVTDMDGKITVYSYDAVGNREKVQLPNNTETVYTYNNLNRLTELVNRSLSGNTINSCKYTLNAIGLRTRIEEKDSVVNYTYDDLYRLTQEERTGSVNYTADYTYDAVGNRLSKIDKNGSFAYTYDDNDRLLSDGKYTYTWDNSGNLITKSGGIEGLITYGYDYENKLTGQTDNTGTVMMAYDGNGNRISASKGSLTTQYLVDTNQAYAQVLKEIQSGGEESYIYGDDLISMNQGGNKYYYHYDGLGSTRALTDASGNVTDSYIYEAFGQVVKKMGSTQNNYLFTGEQYDPNLGFYYLRARYYDQNIGRFTQRDTWGGDPQTPNSLHKYLYTNGSPTNYLDPSGKFTLLELTLGINVEEILDSTETLKAYYLKNLVIGNLERFLIKAGIEVFKRFVENELDQLKTKASAIGYVYSIVWEVANWLHDSPYLDRYSNLLFSFWDDIPACIALDLLNDIRDIYNYGQPILFSMLSQSEYSIYDSIGFCKSLLSFAGHLSGSDDFSSGVDFALWIVDGVYLLRTIHDLMFEYLDS